MNSLASPRTIAPITEPLHRLASDVRSAVADGSWGSSEASALHMWLRADLMPWALAKARDLPNPEGVGHMLAELVRVDADVVASVGEDLLSAVHHLEAVAEELVTKLDGRPLSSLNVRK